MQKKKKWGLPPVGEVNQFGNNQKLKYFTLYIP